MIFLKSVRFVVAAVFSVTLLIPSVRAEDRYTPPKEWTGEWIAMDMPHQSHPFRLGGAGTGGSRIDGDVLRVESTNESARFWELDHAKNPTLWDGSKPFVVEVKARTVTPDGDSVAAGQVFLSNGLGSFAFPISESEFRTYRFVGDGMTVKVFVDNDKDPIVEGVFKPNRNLKTSAPNMLIFGDASSGVGGVSEWASVRWFIGS